MRTTRLLGPALLAGSLLLAACGDDDGDGGTGTGNTATVRFVNATGERLDFGVDGAFAAANSDRAFGEGSGCVAVDPSSGTVSFRVNGQTSTFTPTGFNLGALQPGGTYLVVIGGTSGAYTANVITDAYTGASISQGRARVVNLTGSTYALYIGSIDDPRPTTPVTASLASGAASPWASFVAGPHYAYLTTGSGASQTNVFQAQFPIVANDYITMVVAPPTMGGTMPRSFLVSPCRA